MTTRAKLGWAAVRGGGGLVCKIVVDDVQLMLGQIRFLRAGSSLTVGQFAGAVRIVPTVTELADFVKRMARGDRSVELLVIGDSAGISFQASPRSGGRTGTLRSSAAEIREVDRAEVVGCVQRAVASYLSSYCSADCEVPSALWTEALDAWSSVPSNDV